jgi:hypothetical protein
MIQRRWESHRIISVSVDNGKALTQPGQLRIGSVAYTPTSFRLRQTHIRTLQTLCRPVQWLNPKGADHERLTLR